MSMLVTLREEQEVVKRQHQNCCLALVDVDNLKSVNDKHGHKAGDMVLFTISRNLIEQLRPYDKVFRYGGDEFLLCISFTELADGVKLIERLRQNIEKRSIKINDKSSTHVTVSVGVALLDPYIPIEESLDRADKAMYIAKAEGRNCVRIWNDREEIGISHEAGKKEL